MNTYKNRAGRKLRAVALIAVLTLSACEAPTAPDEAVTPATAFATTGMEMNAEEALVINEDGTFTPYTGDVEVESHRLRAVAKLITGSTAYATTTVSDLRMNVRERADGTLSGSGVATIMGQSLAFTPTCIKENPGFGTPFYGVTVELQEPLLYHGRERYFVTISITDGGNMGGLIVSTDGNCRVSALRYPYEPIAGVIQVVEK